MEHCENARKLLKAFIFVRAGSAFRLSTPASNSSKARNVTTVVERQSGIGCVEDAYLRFAGCIVARMSIPFETEPIFSGQHSSVTWIAHKSLDKGTCENWLAAEVKHRVYDLEVAKAFDEDLIALKAEGFDISALQKLAGAVEPEAPMGDIGEAIADLFLISQRSARLPANRRRDLRSVRGSLPGADIVGYLPTLEGEFEFLFGEVKASSQATSPPSVMNATGDGMPAQIERLAVNPLAQKRLILYLRTRIKTFDDQSQYDSGIRRFASGAFSLTGVLVRDTSPNEKDVTEPAKKLTAKLPNGREATLYVLYFGVLSADWPNHCVPSEAA